MAASFPWTRREILARGVGAVGAVGAIGAALAWAPAAAAPAPAELAAVRAALSTALAELHDPARLGRSYLAARPFEADRAALARALGAVGACAPKIASRLELRRRRDFARGEIIVVEGWVLARSEARACALLALS